MRIRMSESLATVNGNMTAGQEYDVEAREAGRLIAGGIAVAAADLSTNKGTLTLNQARALLGLPPGEDDVVAPVVPTPPGPTPSTITLDALPSTPVEDIVPPSTLPSSLPTDVTPNAGGIPPLGEPDRPTTLPSSLDAVGIAERELKAAEDADPELYGHKLSALAAKSDHELIDLPMIGKAAVKKIREAQTVRDEAIAAAKAKLDDAIAAAGPAAVTN